MNEIKELFKSKKIRDIEKYVFPFITQYEFNSNICCIDQNIFRSVLLFFCPKCNLSLRHYSMPFHIFEYHFKHINEYLTEKQIAFGCAKIMMNEYKKIKTSLKFFAELAILFKHCRFSGSSIWREDAEQQIKELENMDIKKVYFSNSISEAKEELERKLPINKNRNKTRKYKSEKLKL